jgi:hypothetical protein
MPSTPVVTVLPMMLPPPVATLKVTITLATGSPTSFLMSSEGGIAIGVPTVADCPSPWTASMVTGP